MLKKRFLFLVMLISLADAVHAEPIVDPSSIEYNVANRFTSELQTQLEQKTQNGELQVLLTQKQATIPEITDRPTPVIGLTPALQTRSWLFDPSIEIPEDIFDADSKLIAKAGSRINPLSTVHWQESLLFYDGDISEQVNWAQAINQRLQGKVKYILVNGSIAEQTQKLQKPVYFDQGGMLVQRLHLAHLPAIVQQEGLRLRVTEVKL